MFRQVKETKSKLVLKRYQTKDKVHTTPLFFFKFYPLKRERVIGLGKFDKYKHSESIA